MSDTIEQDAVRRMGKCVESMKHELAKLRTGRANPSLLEDIKVEYYGQATPLKQISNIVVEDARTLAITVWEKNMVEPVDKAIRTSDLGLNPVTAGMHIRIPLPPLTEETRKALVKTVRGAGENAKVAIRNVRRDANHAYKQQHKDKALSEDELKGKEESIQKLTDKFIQQADHLLKEKEAELMKF